MDIEIGLALLSIAVTVVALIVLYYAISSTFDEFTKDIEDYWSRRRR